MTLIPDCRTDDNYNEKYLCEEDKMFVRGYDWVAENVISCFFDNISIYPDAEQLLEDNVGIIAENKADTLKAALLNWIEGQRDELITSMLDGYSEEEYETLRAKAEAE